MREKIGIMMYAYVFIFISEPVKFCAYTSKIIENDYKNIDKRVKNNYNCHDTGNIISGKEIQICNL